MLEHFVLGTLTTLNSVMGPLAGPVNTKPVFPLDLNAAVSTEICPNARRGFLGLQLDSGLGREVMIRVSGQICRTRLGARGVALAVNLPADLLDDEFVERLPVGASYVASGVVAAENPELRERLKITREPSDGSLIPLRIEWLPDSRTSSSSGSETQVHHPPLKIWFNPQGTSQMPWQKVEIGELAALLPGPLEIGPAPITVHQPPRRF